MDEIMSVNPIQVPRCEGCGREKQLGLRVLVHGSRMQLFLCAHCATVMATMLREATTGSVAVRHVS